MLGQAAEGHHPADREEVAGTGLALEVPAVRQQGRLGELAGDAGVAAASPEGAAAWQLGGREDRQRELGEA